MTSYDKYHIAASENMTSEGRQESQINLQLEENNEKNVGVITGTVSDPEGIGVDNATVKLCTSDTAPYAHINTNVIGKFTLTSIPAGSYLITAIKEGYNLANPISITVRNNKKTDINITISPDPDANKNVIFGIVKAENKPVTHTTVQLYKKEAGEDVYIGISITNDEGQYLFVNLDDGEYFAKASKIGYYDTQTPNTEIEGKEYLPLDVVLIPDPTANTGVVCGIMTDKVTEEPIPYALVALYSIVGSVETLTKLTKTNVEGKYLFGNIVSGEYKIKSTVQSYEE